jgi:hypothetical protein
VEDYIKVVVWLWLPTLFSCAMWFLLLRNYKDLGIGVYIYAEEKVHKLQVVWFGNSSVLWMK